MWWMRRRRLTEMEPKNMVRYSKIRPSMIDTWTNVWSIWKTMCTCMRFDLNASLEAFPNSEKVKVVVEIFDLLEVHS